jgi:hypothetical protein
VAIVDRPDDVTPVPSWRCPHCRTPQAETSTCWACSRAAISCGSCRHYRLSFVSGVSFCGKDASRAPLTGDEVRSCWQAAEVPDATPSAPDAMPVITAPAPVGTTPAPSGLVEAPVVEPSRPLSTEAARGRRDGRDRT